MKARKIIAGIFALTLFASAAFSVYADDSEEREMYRDMSKDYSMIPANKAGFMFYHAGSQYPGDDAFAYTETNVTNEMYGYAYVHLTGSDDKTAHYFTREVVEGKYIRTENVALDGCSQARKVVFRGARAKIGSKSGQEFRYLILQER